MRTIQRLYVYVMAYASLLALTVGVVNITTPLMSYVTGMGFDREDFALWAGVIVVALPLHLAHALWANARARALAEERASALRKLYLYAVALLGVLIVGISVYRLIEHSSWAVFGVYIRDTRVWWLRTGQLFLNAVWGGILLWYAHLLVQRDGDYLQEPESAARWRRLFVLLVGLGGLVLLARGCIVLIQALLLMWVPPVPRGILHLGRWWPYDLAGSIASMVVGIGMWRWSWEQMWAWGNTTGPERERMTLSRQFYYYIGNAIGVGLFLVALGYLLRQGLWGLLGVPWGDRAVWWPALARWLAALPTGLGVWWVYRRRVLAEQADLKVLWYHLAVGRFYTYVVSAVALAVLWIGAVDLLRVLTAYLLRPSGLSLEPYWWRRVLATGLAFTLVSGPVWFWHWRRIEEVAILAGDIGQRERSSLLRRAYLYGVSLVAGLVLLIFLARVAYIAWLWLLHVPNPSTVEDLANATGPALVALVVWAYHMRVIRRDNTLQRLEGEDVDERRAVLMAERERLLKRLREIDRELAQLEHSTLTPDEGAEAP